MPFLLLLHANSGFVGLVLKNINVNVFYECIIACFSGTVNTRFDNGAQGMIEYIRFQPCTIIRY